jgi:hypothetical protein
MAAPNFKASSADALQAAQDLYSHKMDYKNYELDVATDALAIASVASQFLLANTTPAPGPSPVLSANPAELKEHLTTLKGMVGMGPIMMILIQAAIAAIEAVLQKLQGG